jgi:hypothetical protein
MKPRNCVFLAISPAALALFCAMPATVARSQSQPAGSTAQSSDPPSLRQTKIWTNDNIKDVRSYDSLAMVGGSTGAKRINASAKSSVKTASNQTEIQTYRKQLTTLRADIEKLDAQIKTTKAFISGEDVGGSVSTRLNQTGNPRDQLNQFELKKQADLAKVENILDSARRQGIEPGALR